MGIAALDPCLIASLKQIHQDNAPPLPFGPQCNPDHNSSNLSINPRRRPTQNALRRPLPAPPLAVRGAASLACDGGAGRRQNPTDLQHRPGLPVHQRGLSGRGGVGGGGCEHGWATVGSSSGCGAASNRKTSTCRITPTV